MNGPIKMYRTSPIIRHDLPVEVPDCMYKMKNLLSGYNVHSSEHVSSVNRNLDISEQKIQKHPEMATLEARQQKILLQLAELKEQMLSLRSALNVTNTTVKPSHSCTAALKSSATISAEVQNLSDLVLNVNPSNPPYSLLILQKLWANTLQLVIRTYLHSTVVALPKAAQEFVSQVEKQEISTKVPQILIRLIWKEVEGNMELITSSSLNMPIHGETNMLRYLSRVGPSLWNYESMNKATELDAVLDVCYLLSRARTKTERHSLMQSLNGKLGKSQWLCDMQQMSIADVAASSAIKQTTNAADVNVNLTKWLQRCEKV